MNLKLSLVLIIIAAFLHVSYGEGLYCSYRHGSTIYFCDLTIQNPNGLNNFTEIRGTHSPGWRNEHVTGVFRTSSSISTNVPSIICDTFPNTSGLELWVIGIERVNEDSFRNCRNLFYLDLGGNRISEIDERSFSENSMLNTLFLMGNRLTTLPENIFLNQRNLNRLVLSRNNFTDLPSNIFGSLQALRVLHLSDCQLAHPRVEWFRNLINLQELILSYNNFENFPRNIFNPMQSLIELDLNFNQLKIIHSDWFGALPNLVGISLRANQIDAVDERFIDNTGVYQLDVLNNLCVHDFIIDSTPSRQQLRTALRTCFENFLNLNGCETGNLYERVCKLENENQQQQQQIEDLQNAVAELLNRNSTCRV